MRRDVLDLRAFYASPLGRAARRMISRRIAQAWGGVGGLDILALGYATPFLQDLDGTARRIVVAMPAGQGVEAWPAAGRNLACLTLEAGLPAPNALFDRVLAVHALEESENPLAVLREVHRVLAPSGRAIVAATARHGPWANSEKTPFGHGRPFSRRQLEDLVREADLAPAGWIGALYAPPLPAAWRWAEGFEWLGARLWPPFAGVILVEAVKQTFAVRPQGARARVPARPRYQPAPVGRKVAIKALPAGSAGRGPPRRARSPAD